MDPWRAMLVQITFRSYHQITSLFCPQINVKLHHQIGVKYNLALCMLHSYLFRLARFINLVLPQFTAILIDIHLFMMQILMAIDFEFITQMMPSFSFMVLNCFSRMAYFTNLDSKSISKLDPLISLLGPWVTQFYPFNDKSDPFDDVSDPFDGELDPFDDE